MPLPACTSCRPLENVNSCCMPAAREAAFCRPSRVAMPVAPVEPDDGGGTVAGDVCTPVQNRPQPPTELIGGKIAPEFWVASRSAILPPQPVLPSPVGIAVCHWPVWSECENNCAGTAALGLRYCARVRGCTSIPTLASTAALPWL